MGRSPPIAGHLQSVQYHYPGDENGEGSILQEPIRPNPALAPYCLIPPTKPNGEKLDVPEVWLRYINNNHYDALLKDDHPLMTCGSLKERGFPKEPEVLKKNIAENKTFDHMEPKCDDCNFCFTSKDALEKHHKDTSHTNGFWQMFTEEENVNPVSVSQISKENLVKEVLDFQLTENKKDDKLMKEQKDHNATKKELSAMQDELKKCKAELRRYKIENSDLKAVQKLEKIVEKEPILVIRTDTILE